MKLLIENWRKYLTEEVFYHGSGSDFDFEDYGNMKKSNVGVIYTFLASDKDKAELWARMDSRGLSGGYIYELTTKPDAAIIDLADFSNYGEKAQKIKDYILKSSEMPEDMWEGFILGTTDFLMFDFMDYNDDFVLFLSQLGVDVMKFIDGLEEINIDRIKVAAIVNPEAIESYGAEEVPR